MELIGLDAGFSIGILTMNTLDQILGRQRPHHMPVCDTRVPE